MAGTTASRQWGNDGAMSDPDVRRALPADAVAVSGVIERAIRVSAAGAYPPEAVEAWATGRTVEAVRAMIEVTDGFVATVGDDVVGWANLDGDEIDQLYARRLYETIAALARADGLDQLQAVASLRAEPAFRRFGFREVGTDQQAFNGHTFKVVHMTKQLDRPLTGETQRVFELFPRNAELLAYHVERLPRLEAGQHVLDPGATVLEDRLAEGPVRVGDNRSPAIPRQLDEPRVAV